MKQNLIQENPFLFRYSFGIIFLTTLLLISSCEKDSGPYLITPKPPATVSPDTTDTVLPPPPIPVSFLHDIQPILNANCIFCHNTASSLVNFELCCSYDQIMATGPHAPYVDTLNPTESLLYKRITGVITPQMPMMASPLPDSTITLILKWIEEGAQDN